MSIIINRERDYWYRIVGFLCSGPREVDFEGFCVGIVVQLLYGLFGTFDRCGVILMTILLLLAVLGYLFSNVDVTCFFFSWFLLDVFVFYF